MLSDYKVRAALRAAARNVTLAAVCLLAAFLPATCAGLKPEKDGGALPPEQRAEKQSPPAEERTPGHEALLRGLPAGIRAYLLKIEAAFAARDADFLLAQGEDEYERAARNRVGYGEYLAMLYRAGRYADDAVWGAPSELDPEKVSYIRYTSWREQGPVLSVDGKIYTDEGRAVLFSMKVLWRLNEPRLLGAYP